MGRQISFGQYRMIDNIFWGIILAVSEVVIITASSKWFPGQLYTVSVSAAVAAIVMMRWGFIAAIHVALAGLVYAGVQGGSPEQYLYYIIGNELGLAALLFIKAVGRDRIRQNVLLTIAYALTVQILMQVGRGIVSVVLGSDMGAILNFITMDALSELFSILILTIAARLDGVMEYQKDYLLRVQRETHIENGDNENG